MRIIELDEEVEKALETGELSDIEALSLNKSGHFDVAFPSILNGYRYVIRSKGWVGHIPIGSDIIVNVRPKLPVATLFGMLEVAYYLKSFELLESETGVATIEGLFERIASILAHRVLDRARKGLFQAYVTEHDDLAFVRGRIDVHESLKRSLRGAAQLHCEFQNLTYDLEDNQIVLWTLYQMSRGGLRRPEVRNAVRQAYRVLFGVVQLTQKGPDDCIDRVYHRLNDDYRLQHALCRLLLEHVGPDIAHGENLFIPFKLNMPNLFELFVAEWLKQNAPPEWTVTSQHTAKLKSNAELTFRIDLFLKDKRSGRPIAILDTKYKATELPTEADIQQVVAYAVETGVRCAVLVYPNSRLRPVNVQVGDIDVRCLSFDIASEINSAGLLFLKELVAILPAYPAI